MGSTFIKVAVYNAELRMLASARREFPATREDGRAEADPERVWRAFATAVKETLAGAAVPVTGLVLSVQMAGLALLDQDARPLGPITLGVDRRGKTIRSDPRTGCPPGAIYPAGKLAWLAEHEPARLTAARYIGGVKEYLLLRLAGVWVTDPSSASATGLYDVTSRQWMSDFSQFPLEHLPAVVRPRERAGIVSPEAAAECHLPVATPVLAGLGDGPAANLACGAVGNERLCLSMGTTLVARLLVHGWEMPDSSLPFFVQQVEGDWHCMGVRLDSDDDAYIPMGAPQIRVAAADLPSLLRPLLDTYEVSELRPVGSRCRDENLLRRLATEWELPVRMTNAYDGTRGAALLALDDRDDFVSVAERVAVTTDVAPETVGG